MAFESLFGDGATPEERALRQQANGSILDCIAHRVARAAERIWAGSDRSRLNEYLDDVREIERRIQKIEKYNRERRGARAAGRAAGRAGFLRRAREADVRSAGAGLHDRHHARSRRSR